MQNKVISQLEALVYQIKSLPASGYKKLFSIQSAFSVLGVLITVNRDPDQNPWIPISEKLSQLNVALRLAQDATPHINHSSKESGDLSSGQFEKTEELFNKAWTTFSPETYEHSIELVMRRLRASGFDENYFADKNCFDGGCGTGRLSVAMSRMGAKKITAVDVGEESLEFFSKYLEKQNIKNIEVVRHDVTDLSPWSSKAFDFVASNGVLHHTLDCNKGIQEHFRITKTNGIFWVYLYGEGGLFWKFFDVMHPLVSDIAPAEVRSVLRSMNVREGLIYTFIDNFFAPRVYYSREKLFNLLNEIGQFTWSHASGVDAIDDTKILLSKNYGKDIYGPEGEIRIIIKKE